MDKKILSLIALVLVSAGAIADNVEQAYESAEETIAVRLVEPGEEFYMRPGGLVEVAGSGGVRLRLDGVWNLAKYTYGSEPETFKPQYASLTAMKDDMATQVQLRENKPQKAFGVELRGKSVGLRQWVFVAEVEQNPYDKVKVKVPAKVRVTQGDDATIEVYVQRQSNSNEAASRKYELDVAKYPFAVETPAAFWLSPGEGRTLEVVLSTSRTETEVARKNAVLESLSFLRDRDTDYPNNVYSYEIKVLDDEVEVGSAHGRVIATPADDKPYSLEVNPKLRKVGLGDKAVYKVTVRNNNPQLKCASDVKCMIYPENFRLSVDGYDYGVALPGSFTLRPGQEKTLSITLYTDEARRGNHNFKVNLRNEQGVVKASGKAVLRVTGSWFTDPIRPIYEKVKNGLGLELNKEFIEGDI